MTVDWHLSLPPADTEVPCGTGMFQFLLAGRFAPAAQEWLGIDLDAVTVTPHEAPGWGALTVTGTGPGWRLRASLPVSWLAEVWACGLAVVGGHLVVRAESEGPAGLPAWTRG